MEDNKVIVKCKNILPKINVSYFICDHLIGKTHKPHHRLITGTIIILLGVFLVIPHITFPLIILSHTCGVICHGVGAVPWVELVLQQEKKINNIENS